MEQTKFTCIESPFKGEDWTETMDNHLYAKACVRDCLAKGEIPYASHLFFTQRGILDDRIPENRHQGIMAGKAIEEALTWNAKLSEGVYICTAVYTDRGIGKGMEQGVEMAKELGREVVYRELGEDWQTNYEDFLYGKTWLDLGEF